MKDFATYFNERMEEAEFAEAYKEERREIDEFDRAVRSDTAVVDHAKIAEFLGVESTSSIQASTNPIEAAALAMHVAKTQSEGSTLEKNKTIAAPMDWASIAEYFGFSKEEVEKVNARQRLINQINTEGTRRHTVPIIDIDPAADDMVDSLVEDRVPGILVKRKLPVPRKLSEADMAKATAEVREIQVKMDREFADMERLPPFGIRLA